MVSNADQLLKKFSAKLKISLLELFIDDIFLEIQIRDSEMDYCANHGKASNYHNNKH